MRHLCGRLPFRGHPSSGSGGGAEGRARARDFPDHPGAIPNTQRDTGCLKARAEAEACLAKRCTRSRIEVAGPDISQAILDELAGLAAKHPVDISDLRLHAPALTGLREGTPSFLSFGVGSTQQEDIRTFFPSLFGWIRRNGLQLIRQTNG